MARTAFAVSTVLFSWSVLFGVPAGAAQDALARAKDLYMSAAYEDALVALTDYRASPTDRVEADEYRAFCLLALGKLDDATKVIEQIVTANPTFQPPEAQASPRIQEAFRNVRRRLLPAIVRQIYTDAKSAYDRSDYDVASKQFERVTTLLADADVAASGDLADLRVLSKGFGELIQKQQTAAAAAAPPAAPPPPPPTQTAPKPAESDRVYSAEDADVIAPVAISQVVPPWRPIGPQPAMPREVTLMVLIDETGRVASVRVAGTLLPPYDAQLRQAASRWKYQPATRNGRPVKYRKAVAIRLQPEGE